MNIFSQRRVPSGLIHCGLTISSILKLSITLTLIIACTQAAAHASPARTPPTPKSLSGPATALKTFDSLLEVGDYPKAKTLCTGQVLRMFDFISMAQAKLAGAIDTGLSSDSILEEKISDPWAYVKMSSHAVFTQPMFGQTEMTSTQVIHLYHAKERWLIAEMEELANASAPVQLRSGNPMDTGLTALTHFFPVSPKAPEHTGEANRLQYRLSLKNHASLAPFYLLGPDQTLVRRENEWQWVVENKLMSLPMSASTVTNKNSTAKNPTTPDSLKPYLASNLYLKLDDAELIKTVNKITNAEMDPIVNTGLIYNWVVEHFHFELGSVLFGTSTEVLKDLTGDCSEAAILTSALLRAKHIPSRVAMGFASLGQGVFIGHAWSEAFLNGQWIGVDAALRQYPAGVERIKLTALDGKDDMRISATNLMISVISNLEIEILGAWKNTKPLTLKTYPDNSAQAKKFFDDILKGINVPAKRAQ